MEDMSFLPSAPEPPLLHQEHVDVTHLGYYGFLEGDKA